MSDDQKSRVVVLTGASGGLGRASTVELCRRGWHVIAAVRSLETEFVPLLEAVSDCCGAVEPLLLDLLDESSIDDAGAKLADVPLDAVVHNAGVGAFGAFEDTPFTQWQAIFQVNLLGPMRLTARLLPSMRARGSGRIVAVSSYTARIGIPFASVYGASKAGLERWIETLGVELHSFGLSAHALEVGMFATDIVTESKPPQNPDTPYRRIYDRLEPHRERITTSSAKPPEAFARALADTLEAKNPPILRPVGGDAYALYLAQRLLPSRLMPALLRLVFRQ
jgi:NAD(P)-dependent dehydrogenase (short-subunit alcohol dehydrogenase family)